MDNQSRLIERSRSILFEKKNLRKIEKNISPLFSPLLLLPLNDQLIQVTNYIN